MTEQLYCTTAIQMIKLDKINVYIISEQEESILRVKCSRCC